MTGIAVVCLGETLWDVLPAGEFLGGAPLNVAAHLVRLGVPARLVSRVGDDARGREALRQVAALGLDATLLQIDPARPTGIARAVLDATGSAAYEFPAPCAWDALEATAAAHGAVDAADAVVFGTLAQRSPASAAAIRALLAGARWRVLDANLRAPHVDRAVALASLACADVVKLNDAEVGVFAAWLGVAADGAALWQALCARHALAALCVTEGPRGARLWRPEGCVVQAAYPATVVDTIGAGDAFLAMLLAELLGGSPAPQAMDRAARLAAFVASSHGALPAYDAATFRAAGVPVANVSAS